MLSISPLALKMDFQTWEEAAKVVDVELVASKYRIQYLQNLISDIELTPGNVVSKIMDHCSKITLSSRDFMEKNPGKRLPKDFKKYPGKMDHTTCTVFRVGYTSGSSSERSRFVI